MGVATFAVQALNDIQSTAAIAPSSRFLAEAMVKPLRLNQARVAIELGPGTGSMTRKMLEALPADGRLIAFEINPRFVAYLRENIPDPRLTVLECPAQNVQAALAELNIDRADAALSSLGLSLFPDSLCESIIGGVQAVLRPDAMFTQFQYVSRVRLLAGRAEYFDASRLISRFFPHVERRLVIRNFPPAFVYACRERAANAA